MNRHTTKIFKKSAWRDVYNAMVGLSDEDFEIITKATEEDFPSQENCDAII